MRQLDLAQSGRVTSSAMDSAVAFSFPLSTTDRQVDVVYFDRPGEIHVNLALGRLCPIGCPECSATLLNRRLAKAQRGNLSPTAISQKVRSILTNLAPLLTNHMLVISAMNDGDPLSRTPEEVIAVVQTIFRTCQETGVMLDRLNLSSSLIPTKSASIMYLAEHYADAFGTRLVQLQASLLAPHVKQNIYAGDGRYLRVMIETLGAYREAMRAACGRGETWINYVAVKRGDFGRADGADRLATVAKVADALLSSNPAVLLKITRGTVAGLEGWQQLGDDEYAAFVRAVWQRWGAQLSIYCPDWTAAPAEAVRCGRIQRLLLG
jgi:hypothetical protein